MLPRLRQFGRQRESCSACVVLHPDTSSWCAHCGALTTTRQTNPCCKNMADLLRTGKRYQPKTVCMIHMAPLSPLTGNQAGTAPTHAAAAAPPLRTSVAKHLADTCWLEPNVVCAHHPTQASAAMFSQQSTWHSSTEVLLHICWREEAVQNLTCILEAHLVFSVPCSSSSNRAAAVSIHTAMHSHAGAPQL
jgi:hypothetical protein